MSSNRCSRFSGRAIKTSYCCTVTHCFWIAIANTPDSHRHPHYSPREWLYRLLWKTHEHDLTPTIMKRGTTMSRPFEKRRYELSRLVAARSRDLFHDLHRFGVFAFAAADCPENHDQQNKH